LTFSAVCSRRSTGIHFCPSGQFPSLFARIKMSRDRRLTAPFAQRHPLSRLRANPPPRPTRHLRSSRPRSACHALLFSGFRFCGACPDPIRVDLCGKSNLLALCFHTRTNPLAGNSFPFTSIQNPRGCGVQACQFPIRALPGARWSVPNHILSSVCGLFISLAAFFRAPILYFQSFAHSLAKTPGVWVPSAPP
jgi:hypothetical protein